MLNENVTPFLTRWLRNMTFSQQKNGAIPNVIPLTGIYELLEKLNRIVYRNFEPVGEAGWEMPPVSYRGACISLQEISGY
mgnify:FL=1